MDPDAVGWVRLAMGVEWGEGADPPPRPTLLVLWRSMSAADRELLAARLGLTGADPLSLRDVAKAAKLTQERVRQKLVKVYADLVRAYAYLRANQQPEAAP